MADFDASMATRVNKLVEKTIARNVKGLDYIRAPAAPVGLTPKETVLERGTLRLYHYHPQSSEVYRVPVLLVMATTNKAYIFDLAPGQSMVEFLLKKGFDVFVLDWEAPQLHERNLDLATYTQDFIPSCLRTMARITGEPDASIIGYCMGGVLSTIYAASNPDGPLKNLVCLTTPIDWHHMGLIRTWQDPRYFDVDKLVDTVGIVPADFVIQSFEMQRPAQRVAGQLRVWEQMWNDEFVKSFRAFDRWSNETLPLAGEYVRQMTKDILWENKLVNGTLVVGGKPAPLSNIRIPVLSIYAEHDHLAPQATVKPLIEKISSTDKREVMVKGGHVSTIAGPNAVRRMWPQVESWLAERST